MKQNACSHSKVNCVALHTPFNTGMVKGWSNHGGGKRSIDHVVDLQRDLSLGRAIYRRLQRSTHDVSLQGELIFKLGVKTDISALKNAVCKQTRCIGRIIVVAGIQVGAEVGIIANEVSVDVIPTVPTTHANGIQVFTRTVGGIIEIACFQIGAFVDVVTDEISIVVRAKTSATTDAQVVGVNARSVVASGAGVEIARLMVGASREYT